MFQTIIKNKGTRVWFIVTCILLVLAITVNIVLSTQTLVNLMNTVFGSGRVVSTGDGASYYVRTTGNKEEALANANSLNEEVCEEGIILLKNSSGVLPLSGVEKISVFGKNSVNLVYGGSGSGGGDSSTAKTLFESLEAAGFTCNPTLKSFYEDTGKSGAVRQSNPSDLDNGATQVLSTAETPYSAYTANNIPVSYSEYSDAAIIVLSRIGGEGFDLPRVMENDAGAHYLELDPNEQELIRQVTQAGFGKVILVLNSANTMELGFLADDSCGKIDACLWIGAPGNSGIMALGRVLNGEVTPSGHTPDTYVADFTKDPTWSNFGDNRVADGDRYTIDGKTKQSYFTQYEEGIYAGYRYWETRGFTDGEGWYNKNVVFPFGYGLSYTTFEQEIINKSSLDVEEISLADGMPQSLQVTIKVTNTGDVKGKDVVQVYVTAPYTLGGIEKAHKVLVGFDKTPMLYPAAEADAEHPNSCEITIDINPYDFASYDSGDANKNGFSGYELEQGDYIFHVSRNAHEAIDTFTCRLSADVKYETDPVTGYAVVNRFDDADDALSVVLSRADWEGTWPTTPTDADRAITDAFFNSLKDYTSNNPMIGSYTMPTQGSTATSLKLYNLLQYDEESGKFYADYDDPNWESLLNQISVDEMASLVSNGAFNTGLIESVEKPKTTDADGPVGFTNFMGDPTIYDTCSYACEVVFASTWNKELIEQVGESVGEEGLWGNVKGDGAPYSGWYAPGANIHRSQFGGRNFEYFSEDGFLSGKLAAAEISGAMSKGVYTYVKHFALNEQETHRSSGGPTGGNLTWATEQSMRELYFKPFEFAVKDGGTHGIMSSFNRIGTQWTGGDYRLITEILRNEWGFRGTVICDFNTNSYMDCKEMVYAGGDLNLATNRRWEKYDAANADDVSVLRQATKNILYTVVNSNAMNGYGEGAQHATMLPAWRIVLYAADAVLAIGLAAWGILAFKKVSKKA